MINALKITVLLAALTALLVYIGNLVGGIWGEIFALGFAIVMNFSTYWWSDKLVLKMTHAQPLSEEQAPELYAIVRKLAQRAKVPTPKLFRVPDPSPNAFATGRNPKHAVIAVNDGLLQLLNMQEVEGVLAHEMGHVQHRDTLTSAIIATVAGAIMVLADIGRWVAIFGGGDERNGRSHPLVLLLMTLVVPVAALIIQMAVSRSREYEADKASAYLTGSPQYLISALSKLEKGVERIPGSMSPTSAHMCIVNPLKGRGRSFFNIFATHPPVEKRIQKLQELAGHMR